MERWRTLRHNDQNLPSLLLKASFSKDGYDVRLTDLSRVWSETLERKDIVKQAKRRSCSIDPSEDDEQFQIFLDNIQSALQQNKKTSLALTSTKDGNVKLKLESPLPAPLPAFEWDIDLARAPDDSIKDDIVSPLLTRAHYLNHNVESLIAELQAKDKIIAKITDRLEASGHDLTAVFPGVAGIKISRNMPQQEQLARHVRGLGRFKADAFRTRVNTHSQSVTLSPETTDAIFTNLPAALGSGDGEQASKDWLRRLSAGQHIDLDGGDDEDTDKSRSRALASRESSKQHEVTDTARDDHFQRQATPPNLRKEPQHTRSNADDDEEMDDDVPQPSHHPNRDQTMDDDESTDDEDDLDGPISRSRPAPKSISAPSAKPPRTATPKSPSPLPVPKPSTGGPFAHEEDTATEEESDDDLDKPSQPSQKPRPTSQLPSRQKTQSPQPAEASPQKKLGTLGGPTRTVETPPSSTAEQPTAPSPEPEPAPAPKPKSKLGTLGGKNSQPQKSSSKISSRSPSPKPATKRPGTIGGKRAASPVNTSEPQEHQEDKSIKTSREPERPVAARATSEEKEEKADAKREALKRELEAKAKAPAKKKRKF